MLELVITFPNAKERNLGPLLSAAPEFFGDLVGVRWREVPDENDPTLRVKVDIPKRTKFIHPDMSTPQCLMKHFTPSGMFTRTTAKKWFKQAGFADGSVGSAIAKLLEHGYIKPVSGGKYQFLKEMDLSEKINL